MTLGTPIPSDKVIRMPIGHAHLDQQNHPSPKEMFSCMLGILQGEV